jgi:PAS domain S-box-containing protein
MAAAPAYITVSDRGQVIRDDAGRPVRMVGGMTDLTERKLVEEEIRRNTETLAAIVQALQEISVLDQPLTELMRVIAARAQTLTGADGGVIEMIDGDDMVFRAGSGATADNIGLRLPIRGSLSGLAVQTGAAMLSDDSETDERVDREACRRVGVRSMVVAPLRDATRVIGTLKAVSSRPHAFTWRDVGNLQILAESLGAVIQRQAATERLSESEERFRNLLQSVPTVAIQGYATDGTVQYWNDASERFYGYTRDEALGRSLLDLIIPPEMRDGVRAALQGVAEGRDIPHSELELMRKDGSRITVFSSHAVVRREGRPAELFCIDIDLSERKRAEQRVAEQAALLDKANDAILVRDLSHRILYWNRAAERLYGWTAAEALGRSVEELLYGASGAFLDATKEVLAKGEWTGEIDQLAKDGRTITVEGSWTLVRDEAGRPKSILAINSDVTERKQLQRQFLRAQRMESIGTLAGGIAHDLNNLLAPIIMGAGLLQRQELSETGREVLHNIERSARRSTELVKQVLSFARGVEGERIPLQLGHIVREISHVTFEANLPPHLWLVLGDATQLNQVLLNLCVNARDAMPEGGRLTLRAANRRIDAQYAATDHTVPAGDYVVVEVADTGTGMGREVQDRIFEPFFTTKDLGKGSGLGLSTVLGIVRSHGGAVSVQSEPGRGSTFRVWLPAQAEPVPEPAAAAARPESPEGRGEQILVVDDELPVLTITRQTLEAFGYRVLTAGDGAQAVGLYAIHQKEIAAVLTDLMMPVMDGPMLIASLQRINPQVRVVAATGLKASEYVNRAKALGVVRFLSKPYTADTLLSMMHEVLAGFPEKSADAPAS